MKETNTKPNKNPLQNEQIEDLIPHAVAATILGIKPATLFTLTSKKKITYYKRGKANFFLMEDIIKYQKDNLSKIEADPNPGKNQTQPVNQNGARPRSKY